MDRPDRQLLAGLIATAGTRFEAGPRQLGTTGRSDYFNVIAVEWLRRWLPEPATVLESRCCCPAGRCEACN